MPELIEILLIKSYRYTHYPFYNIIIYFIKRIYLILVKYQLFYCLLQFLFK